MSESVLPDDDVLDRTIRYLCDRLEERSATLFLGAGINAGVVNDNGDPFPMGTGLARLIARELLSDDDQHASLPDVADMARYRLGSRELNRFIFDLFTTFEPGTSHLSLVTLPWNAIYTTNYDLLVEEAARLSIFNAAISIRPIYSAHDESGDTTTFSDIDIPYIKLHGSIDYSNTDHGRLILTHDDYRHYESYRVPLFKRLSRNLTQGSFLFVGYSLSDPNFRAILDDCRNSIGSDTLPPSYAVLPSFSHDRAVYWKEKYNIQLVRCDGREFIQVLKDTWYAQNQSIADTADLKSGEYYSADDATSFPKIGESYYQLESSRITGVSKPKRFFRGAEPTWPDIRDKIPPHRDAYWTLFDAIYPDLANPTAPPSVYLVSGAAGTGKTTLIRSLAFELANGFDLNVLTHIPGTPLDPHPLRPLVRDHNPSRIILIIRHAATYIRRVENFIAEARELSLPITVILEERRNQWSSITTSTSVRLAPVEFELGTLSRDEINSILDSLAEHDALEKLTGMDRGYQYNHFISLAHKDLLVALRELTSQTSFDNIIRNEFDSIPSETAKRAYTYVCTVGQIDVALRYEILIRILGLSYSELRPEVFVPTEGVLISTEQVGHSRHNLGYRLAARHPIVASIIFAHMAPSDEAKMEILNHLLSVADPSIADDRLLLVEIVRNKELVSTLASFDRRRAIFDRLQGMLPDDALVLRHRSILERDLHHPENAIKFARDSLKLNSNNQASLNTLGLALELAARDDSNDLRRQGYLNEALKIFDNGIRNEPTSAFNYLGKAYVQRQLIQRESDTSRRALLQFDMLAMLEEAYEMTGASDVLAGPLAEEKDRVGSSNEALAILRSAVKDSPHDTRLGDVLITMLIRMGTIQEALALALEGVGVDATSWRLQRHLARLLRFEQRSPDSVRGHYEAAIRHHKGDISLLVEFGAFLFQQGNEGEARSIFSQARDLNVSAQEKRRIRDRWKSPQGEERVFEGRVYRIRGLVADILAVPENFTATAYLSDRLENLRQDNAVRFRVGFNVYGAQAVSIERRSS